VSGERISKLEILEIILSLISRVNRVSRDLYFTDDLIQDGVMYNLTKIGEASADMIRLYPEFVETHPDIPFAEARGLRNRLAHDYRHVDPVRVWSTVEGYLPALQVAVELAIKDVNDE
jgi:uncharacterized protein with HEPN domain